MSKIKKLLFGTVVGWGFIGLLVIVMSTALWNVLISTMAIFSVLAPKSTATEIAFYDGESFFGLPFNLDENTGESILKRKEISGQELITDKINKLNLEMQTRLDTKFGAGKYSVKLVKTGVWNNNGGYSYDTMINLTNGLENIETFGVQIKNLQNNITEGIYFYSLVNQIGVIDSLSYKIDDYFTFGSSAGERLGYIDPNGGKNILFLKSDSENSNEQWKIFITQLKTALGNDRVVKQNTKAAYEYLFNNTDDNKDVFTFYPSYYDEFIDGKLIALGSNCVIKYSKSETNDLSCDDGKITINIADGNKNILPIDYFNKGIQLSNVSINSSFTILNDIRNIGKNIIEMNGFRLNDSYFVDMANYVGIDETNSNQAILSRQKVDLSFFSQKQFGKSYKELLVMPTNLQNFTEDNAKKILNYNEKDDVIFTNSQGNANTVKIFKNGGGYSVDGVMYKCRVGQNVVYKNFEDLISGFVITDDTSGTGKKKCSQSWAAPAVLKKAEIKYYKKFVFRGEEFPKTLTGETNKEGTKYNRNENLLNYFYNYEKPRIIDDSLTSNNILSNVDYISQIGLDKKSILWRGVYLKVSGYSAELKEDNANGLSIKRDTKDGSVLFPDSPIHFEIGLLTELNNQTVSIKQNDKGEYVSNIINDSTIDNYVTINSNNIKPNTLLSKFSNSSSFDNISIDKFKTDPTLQFDVPAIYGEKKLRKFNNEYVDLLQKQQKIINILDKNLYSNSAPDKYTPDAVFKKYITLYSTNKEGKNFDICSDYRKISKIAQDSLSSASSSDIKKQALRADSLRTIGSLYGTCINGYFPQKQISNLTIDNYIQSKYGLVNGSYLEYIFATAGDIKNNDLYFLYDYLLKNNSNLLVGDEVPAGTTEGDILNGYISFVSNYIYYNEGDDGTTARNKFINLYTNLANSNTGIILDTDITKLVKSFSQEDRYFIDQEYFNQEVFDEPYSDSYKDNTKETNIKSYSYFFEINNAFSFDTEVYNKSENLHEIYINPNIYLYSFFHYTKTKNKAYNVNVTNENKLMHYSADVNKNNIDGDFLNEYTDHLSISVLGEITKNNYKNIFIKLKNYCTSGGGWNVLYIFSECKTAQSGNFADVNPETQLDFLSKLSGIANNSINKVGYIQNYKNNYSLYNELNSTQNLSYIPSSLTLSSKFLYDQYNNGYTKEVTSMGKVMLIIKLTNLYNYYTTSAKFSEDNKMQTGVTNLNIARADFIKYLIGLYSNYNNKASLGISYDNITWDDRYIIGKSPEELESQDVFKLAMYGFKPLSGTGGNDYAPNITYSEYTGSVVKPIFAYLFQDMGNYKYSYIAKPEDTGLLADYFNDVNIKNVGYKTYGRSENPSGLYSYFKVSDKTVSYVQLKQAFSKVLSYSGSEILSGTGKETTDTLSGTTNGTGETNTGIVYDNISLGDVSSYIDLGYNIFTGGLTAETYNRNQGVNKMMLVASDIESLKMHYGDTTYTIEISKDALQDVGNTTDTGSTSKIEKFEDRQLQIDLLKKNQQCSAYLRDNNAYLYYSLYTYNVGRNDLYVIESDDQLTTDDKIKIFRFFTENNKILNCNGLTLDEYKQYLSYTKNMINQRGDIVKYTNSKLIQEFELYTGINYTTIPKLTLGEDMYTVNDNILNTPLYVMLAKTFNYNNDKSKEVQTKMNYKFIATTDMNGLPLDVGVSDKYRTDELMGIYYQLLLSNTITNNVGLFNGLQALTKEMFNYSLNNNQEKVAFISEFKNIGPFYYLYTNNGFIHPNNGIKFDLVRADALAGGTNMELNVMNIAMYGEKAGINEGLDNVSNTYCEQKSGTEKVYCKNYMEFLKGMDLASYKQEIEFMTALVAAKKVLGENPITGHSAYVARSGPTHAYNLSVDLGTIQSLNNKIKSKDSEFYQKYFNVVFDVGNRNGSWVGQCTWFAQLYKDYKFSGNGGWLGSPARNLGYSVDSYGGKSKEEKMKLIQVGDIISFHGFNSSNGCLSQFSVPGHVGMVVGKGVDNYTIDVAQGNVKSFFMTDVQTLKVDTMCNGDVIHGISPRYGTSDVVFSTEAIVPDTVKTNTGTTNSGTNL